MFSGIIVYYLTDCVSIVVNAMLGGELLRFQRPYLSSIDLTKYYHSSHHDCSVTCHVSAIPKDAHIPRCVLPCCPGRLRSAKRYAEYRRTFLRV